MQKNDAKESPKEPTLSACMIVRNEEKLLPQCLESIKGAVDEIILVDTGSTDRTVEIAEKYGARVFHHPWRGDFSEARNYSLQQATCDWILVVDADEKLEREDIPALREALRQEGHSGILAEVLSETPSGVSKNNSQRIFRRGMGHYEGIVHNQLVCDGNVLATKIRIYHYGYNLSPEQMKEKNKRTTELLKKQIAERPDFIFARANLVRAYRCQELWDNAIETAEEALKLEAKYEHPVAYQMMLCDMTYSLFVKGDYEKAEETCMELLKENPDSIDGHFYMGGICIRKREHDRAVDHYRKYIALSKRSDPPDPRFINVIVDSYGAKAQVWNNMGNSYVELGQLEEAVAALSKAVFYDKKNPLHYENLSRALRKQDRPEKAAEVLEDAVNLGIATSRIHRQLSDIYNSQGKTEQAEEQLTKTQEMEGSVATPTISACMIVKNEERFLPQCLESIKNAVDEIIIVDTGSTDRTVEIAESYGAKVFHHPWNGSFSEARNHSLKYATCDWILVIDADEKLERDDVPLLRAALKLETHSSIWLAVLNKVREGISMSYSRRVFRRGMGHYKGIVHNQLICEGRNLVTDIRIHHYGYDLSPQQMREKQKRTEELLKKQIAEEPDYMTARINLTRIYRSQGLWDDAIKTAEEALNPNSERENPVDPQMMLCDMTYALFMKGNYEEAEASCGELLRINPDNLDGQFYMGGICVARGEHEKAVQHYRKYIDLLEQGGKQRQKFVNLIVDTYGSQDQAWNNMGNCYIELHQPEEAVAAFQKAISHDAGEPLYYENLGRAFLEQDRLQEAVKILGEAVNSGIANSQIHRQLSSVYSLRGEVEQAEKHLKKAREMDSANKVPTLSACMIVKDEEELLPQCLESIRDVVDEIIVVDTGSTDRTVEIAESYGAKVYHHPWRGDFSEARNYSLQYATCDWIMVVDADEKLEKDDTPILRATLKHREYNCICFAVLSEISSNTSLNYSQRVFRRGTAHYEGIVHNQLISEGQSLVTKIRLYHYGYDLSPEQMKKKYKRTEGLLKKQIAEEPDYMFPRVNLTRIYRCQDMWDDAVRTGEEALKLESGREYPIDRQMILGDMSYALLMSKDYDRAAVRCAELLEANPENMDGHFYMGSIYISKGNYRKSIRHYMEYIRLSEPGKRPPSKFVALITDTYGSQAQAWNNIGNCHANLREFDRAALAFQKAISHDGEIALYYENYAYSLLDLGNPDKAAEVLENAVGLGIATRSIHQKLSNIYRSQEKLDKAVEHLRKALEMDTSDVSYCINLGELLILQSQRVPESSPGLLEEAEATLHKALGLESGHPLVLHHLARINSLLSALSAGNNGKADRDDKVSRYIDEIMELDDIGSGQYMQMGNDWIAIERYDRAIMFYEKCLESGPGNCDVLINLANCYAKMGMYESAFTGYQAALAMRPNDPTVIGNLLAMKNDINQAITSSV